MSRVTCVLVAVALCLISACSGASVAEYAIDARQERLGNVVRYYKTSRANVVSGVDLESVENSASAVASLGLSATVNVVIVVHGRDSSVYDDFANTLKFSLASVNQDMIIFLLDWSVMSMSAYEQAAALVPFIAEDLRDFMSNLNAAGVDQSLLHLIGFDLGAHIVGIANRQSATTARAIKITALSPAGERWGAGTLRIRASDANTVEVIHTDNVGNSAYGITEAVGTLDIFVNGGTRQPGCANSDNACHHRRAYQLFAATVDTGGHLLALRCDSMTQVNNNRCVGTPAAFLGTLALLKLQTGLYRVNTGSVYPYNV